MVAGYGDMAMIGFILVTIVAGFFGPWVISLLLGALCVGCWGLGRLNDGEG